MIFVPGVEKWTTSKPKAGSSRVHWELAHPVECFVDVEKAIDCVPGFLFYFEIVILLLLF